MILRSRNDIARYANAKNNANYQELRFERWREVRDAAWLLIEPRLDTDSRVCLVGAGSCDDVPLARIAARATEVDLVDFDPGSTKRAIKRLPRAARARVHAIEDDVTGGSADIVLRAARDGSTLPDGLPLPHGPLGDGEYDLVVGDMLYTQLLHAGLLSIGIPMEQQRELMSRYDPPLANALVHRLEASVRPGGHAIHIHDLACWSTGHDQPVTLGAALAAPEALWEQLRRHDPCDPHLILERTSADIVETRWWRWPFEPNKESLVRASVMRASSPASSMLRRM